MRKSIHVLARQSALLAAGLFAAAGLASAATTVNLTAQRATALLPDGNSVPMWQFCGAAASGSSGTTVGGACATTTTSAGTAIANWAPGPTIVLPVGDTLTVNLTNKLPVATSFTIVGQLGGSDMGNPTRVASPAHAGQATTTWMANGPGSFVPPAQGSRARAFGQEAAPGGTASYSYGIAVGSNAAIPLQPGTYLYQTGTHPSLQQPMGLYGVLVVTTAPVSTVSTATPPVTTITSAGKAYPTVTPPLQVGGTQAASSILPPGSNGYGTANAGAPYDADAVFLLSEIDPVQNAAVDAAAVNGTSETLLSNDPSCSAAEKGGTVPCYPAAVNYRPTYFLINGSPFNPANPAATTAVVADGAATGNVLLRFANAGSRLHTPAISGLQMAILSEDGNLAPGLPKVQSEVNLPPGRTVDALVNPAGNGTLAAAGTAAAPSAYTDRVYSIFDRALSTASGNVANTGMHGYLAVAPAGTGASAAAINLFLSGAPGGIAAATAFAASYTFTIPPNVLPSFSANVNANSVGLQGVVLGTGPTSGTVTWTGSTFTYTPASAPITLSDSFTYCSATSAAICGKVTLTVAAEAASIIAPAAGPAFNSTVSTLYRAVTRASGLLAAYSASDGYPLNAALVSGSAKGCGLVVVNADGTFSATPTARTGGSCSFQFTVTDPRSPAQAQTATATVSFPAPSNYKLTIQDALNGTAVGDYMWQIEEDRTYFPQMPLGSASAIALGVTPPCLTVPGQATAAGATTTTCTAANTAIGTATAMPTPTLATSFHESFMPVVATGCTGQYSCGDAQALQGSQAKQFLAYTTPADVALDPTKHYYISILPGDAANPFINGYFGDPTANNPCLFGNSGAAAAGNPGYLSAPNTTMPTNCGHTMGGGQIAPGQLASTVTVEPNPLKPAALSIFIFEDNSPTNNDYDANEIGLGGFEIIVNDVAGRSGDPVGQVTFDAFNMPLTNKLLGVQGCPNETPAATSAKLQTNLVGVVYTCPDGDRPISSVTATASTITVTTSVPHQFASSVQCSPGTPCQPTVDISGLSLTPLNGSFTVTVTGANSFTFANPGGVAAGQVIQVWPSSIARDSTTYQLAGQALINNIMPGRYDVLAHPGADREGAGQTWYQVSTLEGTPGQDAFTKAGEPNYFQEFGPPGFHTFIGWLNPAHISDQNAIALAQAKAANIPGQTGTVTISGRITSLHMSRPIMETLWDSASNASIAQSTCFVGLNQTGETGNDVGFTSCNPDGTFTLPAVPQGQQYELVVWDQWLDQIIAFKSISANQVTSTKSQMNLNLADIPVFSWFTRVEAKMCLDTNGNGVCDAGEPGLSQLPVTIHFRDGSISNVLTTDGNGNAVFNELFPLFNWYVIESDNVRYASTGVNVTVDGGGQPDCVTTNTANGQGTLNIASGTRCPGGIATNAGTSSSTALNSISAGVLNSSYVWTNPITSASFGAVPAGASTSTNRIDPGTTLYNGMYEGLQTFINQTEVLSWGRRNFNVGENGGIQGMVVYSSTRGFDDPSLQVQNLWEPGIARVTVNLYREQANADGSTGYVLVNSTLTTSWDDWANAVAGSDGKTYVLGPDNHLYVPGTWAPAPATVTTNFKQINMTCPGQDGSDPYVPWSLGGSNQFRCYDGFHMWNQVQPAVFDGLYMFTTDAKGNKLAPATYVVEVVPPPGYEIVKEEDKNILIGDQWVAPAAGMQFGPSLGNIFVMPDQATLSSMYNSTVPAANASGNATQNLGFTQPNLLFPKCVGTQHQVPDFMSLFPQSGQIAPFAGAMKNLCDRKEVVLNDQMTGVANFFLFTMTPRASHFTGLMLDDMAAEINNAAPDFGEKFALGFAPVAMRDPNGVEVGSVYTDQWGTYNGLMYSTWQVNVPNPAGYSPNMMVNCMNDPGPRPGTNFIDPQYNAMYSNFCYTNPFMPGMTVYLDTPVVPVAAFASHFNPPDCALPAATPAIARVDGDGKGPWVGVSNTSLASVSLTGAGSGYTGIPAVTVSGGGKGASVVVNDLKVVGMNLAGSSGYTAVPNVRVSGGGLSNVTATATIAGGAVTAINLSTVTGYTSPPTISIAAPTGTPASATVNTSQVVTITAAGAGYCTAPQVTVSGGTRPLGSAAWTATATIKNLAVSSIKVSGATKYTSAPTLRIAAPNCPAATATALMGVDLITLASGGSGYTSPTLSIAAPTTGTRATASATLGTSASQITITALGDVPVLNPNYQGFSANTAPWNQKNLTRHYGFGTRCTAIGGTCTAVSSVTVGGVPATITGWNDTTITANVANAKTGELVITSGNGLKSVDAVTVNIGETKTPTVVEPAPYATQSTGNAHPIQDAIDAANPGDLIIVDAGSYPELVVMWKPVRLQGVGAPSVVINAAKYPTQKLQNWRPIINRLFGVDTVAGNQVANSQVDPLPNQEITGGIVWLEPSVLATEEGAGITVLAKNPATAPCGSTATSSYPDQLLFPPTSNTVNTVKSSIPMSVSNFDCAPSRIDGLSVTGSDSGGGIYVNGWADNLEIANNRVYGNAGSYNGGIRVGIPYLEALTYTPTNPDGTVFGFDKNVHIHHNVITNNGTVEANPGTINTANSTGAGGGLSICTGTDNYLVNYNFICGNFSQGDGGGIGQTGVSNNGVISQNTIVFNQSFQQTAQVNGGGIVIEGELGTVGGLSLGTGNVTIDRNIIRGNYAEGGHGGGIRLQQVNGSDVGNNPENSAAWYGVTITNNMITNNVSGWAGGGISAVDALAVTVANNTIAYNDSLGISGSMIGTDPLNKGTPLSQTSGYPSPAGVSVDRTTTALLTGLPQPTVSANQYANLTLVNDILYSNRSFYFAITSAAAQTTSGGNGLTTVNQQNTLCPSNSVADAYSGACVPLAAQASIGACDTKNARYWDIGTTDDASATPGSNALGLQLAPRNSVITAGYAGNGNTTTAPTFTHAYCNGARANPAFIFEPGQPFLDPATQNLTAGATLDEAGNFVDVVYGPLYLFDPTTSSTSSPGTSIGDYHIAASGGAYNTGASIQGLPETVVYDLDGDRRPEPRASGSGVDIGADEVVTTGSTAVSNLDIAVTSFGLENNVQTGQVATATVTVTNVGTPASVPLRTPVAQVTGIGNAMFTLAPSGNTCNGLTLAAGASCTFGVRFAPTGVFTSLTGTAESATLTVTPTSGAGASIVLGATAWQPYVSASTVSAGTLAIVSPTNATWTGVPAGADYVTLVNNGYGPVYFVSAQLGKASGGGTFALATGAAAGTCGQFAHTGPNPVALAPGQTCTVGVVYKTGATPGGQATLTLSGAAYGPGFNQVQETTSGTISLSGN